MARLLAAGVKVALGTDGAASNNDLDMLSELRVAALLGKGVAGSASAVPPGRRCAWPPSMPPVPWGWTLQIGSLEPGKAADLVALDLRDPDTQPVYQPLSQLVYAASRDQVRHVWVAGRQLVRDGVALTLDREAILTQARDWGAHRCGGSVGLRGQCVGRGGPPRRHSVRTTDPGVRKGAAAVCAGSR